MKVKEIQIGDWISSPYGNMQVEFIYNNGYDDVVGEHEEMYLDWDTGEEDPRMKDITIEMVEPIPLTEEIVKLIGFKKCSWDLMRWKCDDGFSIDKENNIFYAYICGNLKPITYVHELQHLLRLCGLNDLADNFKIE